MSEKLYEINEPLLPIEGADVYVATIQEFSDDYSDRESTVELPDGHMAVIRYHYPDNTPSELEVWGSGELSFPFTIHDEGVSIYVNPEPLLKERVV